ncbi:hypothetical protein [Paenibacillus thermotolerans]|uniref:hypothetical protein n=1 Tax=Paenibacillus thermotolerans TaxID=3027807 RepID=UPI002367FD13|nr:MULTISPECIES: hypothetical protein [unclassified Paenibacillus]
MKEALAVPRGDEKVTIELTVKEAIALTGVRFNEQPELLTNAKKKLKQSVDTKVLEH